MSGSLDLIANIKSGLWLTRERVIGYAAVLLIIEIAAFIFCVAGTHGLIVPLATPTSTDFVSFYAAGMLADAGTPALAYDQAAHFAAEQSATEPGIGYIFFFYPPVFLMLCATLARLPYLVAFVVFELATLLLYLPVARATLEEKSWDALLPVLAFPAVAWTIGFGQNSFLTAAIFGAALLSIDRRPILSGLLFGCLCYKPHFGLLVPIALAAGGRWRVFAAAASSAALIVALSVLVFGWETWSGFLQLAAGSNATYESGRVDFAAFVSTFGAVRLNGGTPQWAYVAQALMAAIAAALVAIVWRRDLSLPVRASVLAAATLVAIPLALFYDLILAALAAMWLVRGARKSGFLPWEKTALFVLFLIPLMPRDIAKATHVPLAPLAAIALLVLCYARARQEMAQTASTAGLGAVFRSLLPVPRRRA